MKKLLITVPCHNEALVLEDTLNAVHDYANEYLPDYDWHILVIDNASSDDTFDIAKRFVDKKDKIEVVRYMKKGRGSALKSVWLEHDKYDIYSYMDADLATDLKDFRSLVVAVDQQYDLAVGSRYLAKSKVNRTLFRKVASKIYNFLAHWFLPVRFSDAQCGFKAMRTSFVKEVFPKTVNSGWFWDTELMVFAGMNNKRVLELPVTWKEVRTRQRKSTVQPMKEMVLQLKNIKSLRKKLNIPFPSSLVLFAIILGFILLLLFGLNQVYHQDEYRWVEMVLRIHDNPIDHPPITPFLYGIIIKIFGVDWMRILPAIFGILNLILVYAVTKLVSKNEKIALLASSLFGVSSYSLIASLQIDIDGAVLPFFVLASIYAYLRVRSGDRGIWWLYLVLAIVGGILTKLSFVICIGAIALDYAMLLLTTYRKRIAWKSVFKWATGGGVVLALAIFAIAKSNDQIVSHALDIELFQFSSRAYLDLAYKVLKSMLLLSPLLFLPAFFGIFVKSIRNDYRIWYIFLALNSIFYLVLFDFSALTVERYFMFLIAPCAILSTVFLKNLFDKEPLRSQDFIKSFVISTIVVVILISLPHYIIPQYPKIEFVNAIKNFDFSFLIPVTGGSGPSGLYVSARFVIWIWAFSILALLFWRVNKRYRSFALALFVLLGLYSNLIVTQEYLFGGLYGSVSSLIKRTVTYVNESEKIDKVVTYYDIGQYDLQKTGKYQNRFYVTQTRDYSRQIKEYRGYYMIVDFPKIAEDDRYFKEIKKCNLVNLINEKEINSYIYDCTVF